MKSRLSLIVIGLIITLSVVAQTKIPATAKAPVKKTAQAKPKPLVAGTKPKKETVKPVFYKTPAVVPEKCQHLPEFKFDKDSLDIQYTAIVDQERTDNLFSRINMFNSTKDYLIRFDEPTKPDKLTGSYTSLITSDRSIGANITITVRDNSVLILVDNPYELVESSDRLTKLADMRAVLYAPKLSSDTPYLCERLIVYDQKLKEAVEILQKQVSTPVAKP